MRYPCEAWQVKSLPFEVINLGPAFDIKQGCCMPAVRIVNIDYCSFSSSLRVPSVLLFRPVIRIYKLAFGRNAFWMLHNDVKVKVKFSRYKPKQALGDPEG
jgi:hypothetical protein